MTRAGGRPRLRRTGSATSIPPRTLVALAVLLSIAGSARHVDGAPLPLALAGDARVQSFGVYGVSRRQVVAVTAPGSFTAGVTMPPHARLRSAIAVPDRIWTTSVVATAAPVTFRIVFESEGATTELYERRIDIASVTRDRRWWDVGVDLAPLAGRPGTLRFEAAAGAGAGTLALWEPPELVACDDSAPSLLLVTIDALRGDHLGSAGYMRPTTPYLDALATDATRFVHAFSAGPKTIPSIPQILTGRYFFPYRSTPDLAPLLAAGGADSRAIVNNPFVSNWLERADPGFRSLVAGELDARAITSEALRFLSAAGRCRTTLYLHYLDTHTPYHAPPRYARKFVDRSRPTTIGLTFGDVTGAWQGRYGEADRRRIADLYDGSIAWVDRQLGRLLHGLERRGRRDRTIVVVTADHGEELWDHGQFMHGQSLYDELLHVPLIVRLPQSGHGAAVDALVSTVDVLPSIRDGAGLPTADVDGTSLVPLAGGGGAAGFAARTIFATVSHPEPRTPPRHAVRSATHKLIHNVADGSFELYDLTADPGERRNLGLDVPAAIPLRDTLAAYRARLWANGDHLRLRSTSDHPIVYRVTLTGDPAVPIIEPDRLTLESGDRIAPGQHASALTVSGTLAPGDEDHVRFEIIATSGRLNVTITLAGTSAPPGTLRLGASAAPSDGRVELADPALIGDPGAAVAAPSAAASRGAPAPPVTVELWRTAAVGGAGVRPFDAKERERLRALGYIE